MKGIQYLPLIGMVALLAILMVIAAIIVMVRSIRHPKTTEAAEAFDERQVLARSAAYKAAFCTLAGYCFCCGLLYAFGVVWADTAAQMFVGVGISGTVFTVICMVKDAYLMLNDKRRWCKVAFSAFIFAFCWLNATQWRGIELDKDAVIVYAVYSVGFCIAGIVATVKAVREGRSRR